MGRRRKQGRGKKGDRDMGEGERERGKKEGKKLGDRKR